MKTSALCNCVIIHLTENRESIPQGIECTHACLCLVSFGPWQTSEAGPSARGIHRGVGCAGGWYAIRDEDLVPIVTSIDDVEDVRVIFHREACQPDSLKAERFTASCGDVERSLQ
eukprot:CAMPEP_0177332378 /NCGR_PEP_ID=MMETSP0368-20130122/21559_1 /TAXON_ID=447022 ORGANISM="Scrippsiella hangoei-like, Strain SHHI-4" /NCGR_SAMPLE_ID=MMETSP0368 /ASSEMBLY_ACC=CAM_ASM_000363 /LENGTH=114 /DNA_ID=CAMNT_0018792837 /DNA_START=245 /DNA_END=586 /DNA_ORIENTATION=+